LNEVQSNVRNILEFSKESQSLLILRLLNKGAIIQDGDVTDDGPDSSKKTDDGPANRGSKMFDTNCAHLFLWHPMFHCNGSTIHFYSIASIYYGLSPPHFKIPAGTVTSISLIALTVFIVIYDRIMVPFARQFTGLEGGITLLQRQGVGLVFSPISMVVAGLLECKRRNSALSSRGKSPTTVLWLAP
jgi:hypothetical protein